MAIVDVISEVTGTVWKIVAVVGQSLCEDDEVMVVESMKMEIPVSMPSDGVIKEILVIESDAVQEGQVVARIEEN